jgi:sulfopyruvate decarboxylase alpha subunit
MTPTPATDHWSTGVMAAMRARQIKTVCTVPDGGLTQLLKLVQAEPGNRLITLTTEEEGIGVSTGLWLGGEKCLVAMQSSGVGNCINALGLASTMRAPLVLLVTMRGQWGEFNPWQVSMGQATKPVLEAVGVKCFPVEDAAEVAPTFAAAADFAHNSRLSVAVLVGQRVIGAKGFGQK